MEKDTKELRVKVVFEEKAFLCDKLTKIDRVIQKIKELEKEGEYKCTLLEVEI